MDIKTVINSITTAEMEADNILHIAANKAKDVQLCADIEAARLVADAKKLAKETYKQKLAGADKNVEVVVKKKIKSGLEESKKALEASDKNIDKAVDLLVGKLMEQYGDC